MGIKFGVYGTLRFGSHANGLMKGCKYHGKGTVEGRLFNLGSYPGIRLRKEGKEGESGTVICDIYEIPEGPEGSLVLQGLDRYEGYVEHDPEQSLYIRKEASSDAGPIQIYEYNGPVQEQWLIKSGDWYDK